MANEWITKQTLLQRAQNPDDGEAWQDFVNYYTDFIHVVLRKMSFHAKDLDDITQDILIRIWQYLSSFDGNKHQAQFRTWLSTLIRNQALNFIKKKQGDRKHEEKAVERQQAEGLISQTDLDKIVEYEWIRHLTTTALNNIRSLFSGVAVQVFECSLEGKTSKEIGQELNINPESVRTLKNRVKLRLMKEITQLREELEF